MGSKFTPEQRSLYDECRKELNEVIRSTPGNAVDIIASSPDVEEIRRRLSTAGIPESRIAKLVGESVNRVTRLQRHAGHTAKIEGGIPKVPNGSGRWSVGRRRHN